MMLTRGALRSAHEQRTHSRTGGAIMVEFLIAYVPVLVSFLMFWQLGELIVAQLIVERASAAAGRAAIVVLPDDPAFYDGDVQDTYSGNRERQIRMAAGMILQASPHLSENFTVDVNNIPTQDDHVDEITVNVAAEFRCERLPWVCGLDGMTLINAATQHTYQGARFDYEPADLSTLNSQSDPLDPSCSGSDTPNAGGKGNNGSGGSGAGNVPKGLGGSGSGGGGRGSGGNGSGGKGNGAGGKGSGGSGGKEADPSGSCPPGMTAQADGSCAKTCAAGSGAGPSCPVSPCPSGQKRNAQNVCSCPGSGAGTGSGSGSGTTIAGGSGTQCPKGANSCPCSGANCKGPTTCAMRFTGAIDRLFNGQSTSDTVCNGSIGTNLKNAVLKAAAANKQKLVCESKPQFEQELADDLLARNNGQDKAGCDASAANSVNGGQSCRGFTTLGNKVVLLAPSCDGDLIHEYIHIASGKGGNNGLAGSNYNGYNEAMTEYLTGIACTAPSCTRNPAYADSYTDVINCLSSQVSNGDQMLCKAYFDGSSDQMIDALAQIYRSKLQKRVSLGPPLTNTESARFNDPAVLKQFIADQIKDPTKVMKNICK